MRYFVIFQTALLVVAANIFDDDYEIYSEDMGTCDSDGDSVWSPKNYTLQCEKQAIIGGKTANIADFPYQLALTFKNTCFCGASIITKSWALTAAHCFDQRPLIKDIAFRAGSTDHKTGGKVYKIVKYFVHPHYRMAMFDYDVAVVKIDSSFVGVNIKPVTIIGQEKDVMVGSKVTVSGWGLMQTNGAYPRLLQKVNVRVMNQLKCHMAWKPQDIRISKNMLCAGGEVGHDTCLGDSGGPLVQNGVQVGIVSFGSPNCGTGIPSVYARISAPAIRDFIRKHANI